MADPRRRSPLPVQSLSPAPRQKKPNWWPVIVTLAIVAGVVVYKWPMDDEPDKAPASKKTVEKAKPESVAKPKPVSKPVKEEKKEEPVVAPEPDDTKHQPDDVKPDDVKPDEPVVTTPEPDDVTPVDPEPKPDDKKPVSTEDPGVGPYSGKVSIIGKSHELQNEWSEMIERLADVLDVDVFCRDTDARITKDISQIFDGKKFNDSKFRSSETLIQAVEVCFLIHEMGPDALAAFLKPVIEDDGRTSGYAFWRWCLTDKSRPLHRFVQAFKLNGGNNANLAYSFNMFYQLWKRTNPRHRASYLNLALACSLVCPSAANSPGMLRNPKEPLLSMPEVYDYFVEMDGKRKLLTDIKKLSVMDMLLMVDMRLTRSEFEWVHKKLKYKRAGWGQAYEDVKYVMERATQGEDPYTTYTFADILENGGVCRDRAYFAANTAKCMGIPATYVAGDGPRGGHAWVNLLTSDKAWTMTGSYGYKTGRYMNPCSGRSQHESVLLERNKKMTEDKLDAAANLLLFSDYLVSIGKPEEAMIVARKACDSNEFLTSAWWSCHEIMKSLDEKELLEKNAWKKWLQALMSQGKKNAELLDLAQEVQMDYVLADANATTKKRQMARTAGQLEKMVGDQRTDLMLESIERQATLYAEGNDWRGLNNFFMQQYKRYKDRGDIYGALLGLHEKFLRSREMSEREMKSQYKKLAHDAEKIYIKNAYKGDYFKVQKDAAVMTIVANLYSEAGEWRKAEKIKNEAEKIVAESARRAEGN